MTKLLSTAKILLLFSILTPLLVEAGITKLPILSISGKACDRNERVSATVRVEASRYAPAYCHSEVQMPDRQVRYPHSFSLYGVTVSDYYASFAVTLDVMEGLKERIFSYHPNGVSFDGTQISTINYFKNCNFQIKEVTIYTQETTLVVRDSFYNRLENMFKVPQGTTMTEDYSFNRSSDRIRFKVFVLKGE